MSYETCMLRKTDMTILCQIRFILHAHRSYTRPNACTLIILSLLSTTQIVIIHHSTFANFPIDFLRFPTSLAYYCLLHFSTATVAYDLQSKRQNGKRWKCTCYLEEIAIWIDQHPWGTRDTNLRESYGCFSLISITLYLVNDSSWRKLNASFIASRGSLALQSVQRAWLGSYSRTMYKISVKVFPIRRARERFIALQQSRTSRNAHDLDSLLPPPPSL